MGTAGRLRLDSAIATVSAAYEQAGIRALLLKGPSLEEWLYHGTEKRNYLDCDLLVAPEDVERAEKVLVSAGYVRDYDDRPLPDWWREPASAWIRHDDGVTVDLHRNLSGVKVDDHTAWAVLSRAPARVRVAARDVMALSLPARALHVALHAAHHGSEWSHPINDLQRALAQGDADLWRSAAALARELDATDAFAAGLRLTPAGEELARRLELPTSQSVATALRASTPPPVALGFEQLAGAGGLRARVEIVWHKLFPHPEFMRHWDPRAHHSRLALVRAYLRRPVWLAQNAPAGFRAWRKARRSVRRDG